MSRRLRLQPPGSATSAHGSESNPEQRQRQYRWRPGPQGGQARRRAVRHAGVRAFQELLEDRATVPVGVTRAADPAAPIQEQVVVVDRACGVRVQVDGRDVELAPPASENASRPRVLGHEIVVVVDLRPVVVEIDDGLDLDPAVRVIGNIDRVAAGAVQGGAVGVALGLTKMVRSLCLALPTASVPSHGVLQK